ncbi:MAG TPA: GNAT family N-acetyltransferase [Xanthobacteraceae bacterium]|jgi:GNAT superfamily N-acetyltransferase|nr:GNAT family N-acetyltransferase [Xanthobacteraceae bacterium]
MGEAATAPFSMNPTIRELRPSNAEAVSTLSLASFERFIAGSWSSAACNEYRALVSASALSNSIESCAYSVGAFNEHRLLGFLLMPRPSLVQMFFVDPELVRQGIGRSLWKYARGEVEARFPEAKTIELNASPYAVEFYRSLGFVPISKEFESKGFRATRMACWLAARALGAEL